jgi:hypothetical protein
MPFFGVTRASHGKKLPFSTTILDLQLFTTALRHNYSNFISIQFRADSRAGTQYIYILLANQFDHCTKVAVTHHKLKERNLAQHRDRDVKPSSWESRGLLYPSFCHGPLAVSANRWRAFVDCNIMSRWFGILFYFYSRYNFVLTCWLFLISPAASMFFKSCNCNSSIATRVGFAVRVSHLASSFYCALNVRLDYILF